MARVNILKRIKVDGRWKMVSIPRRNNDNYDWKSLPDGRYLIEWYERCDSPIFIDGKIR